MTMKKTIVLLFAVICILSALASCGGNGGSVAGLNTAKVEFPALPQEYAISNNVTGAALQQYIYARLKLEQLTQAESPEEFEKLIAETIEAFEYADEFAEKAVKYADYAVLANEDNPQAKETGKVIKTAAAGAVSNPFVLTAYAAEEQPFDAKTWAEDITKKFDAGQAGQQVKNLAEQLGVDAKEAYNQLLAAQDIIKKGADADAAFFDTAMKAAMATKTACKVGMLVTGTIVTAGGVGAFATGYATVGEAAVFMVNSADCIVDIGVTASTIIVGEDHKLTANLNAIADKIAPVTALTGLHGLYKTDFSKLGKITKLTDEAVGIFDYVGQSLADYMYNDKVMGVDVSSKPGGKTEVTATAIDIPQTKDGKVDADKLNQSLAQANLPAIPAEAPALKPIDQTIDDFKQTMPDPVVVSKQIDEALKQIEDLLNELGKAESTGAVAGTYSGICHYASIDRDGDTDDADIEFTIEISATDKDSNNCEVRIFGLPIGEYYWVDRTFTGKFDGRHFQGSYNKVDGVDSTDATIMFNLSEAGDSLTGEMVEEYLYHNPGSQFDDDWSTTTITLNMTKQ
jgi:effector-binding domain-containing protein